ncbi:MAG: HigA family addiction module antitoxin [Candidatus Parabeggiatoa sp.]|nr:HigA family addiction module antitoxin [Candidatus Parabeggiatoa sp.]
MRIPTNQPPIHPGEILQEEFLKPYHITTTELAEKIELSVEQINAIIKTQQSISTDMALRLSRLFGTSPELWLNGQMKWDIWLMLHGKQANQLDKIKPIVPLLASQPSYLPA